MDKQLDGEPNLQRGAIALLDFLNIGVISQHIKKSEEVPEMSEPLSLKDFKNG